MIEKKLQIYIYDALWQGSSWLSEPTTALLEINNAFDSITNLKFSGIFIISSISSLGISLTLAVDKPIYKDKIFLDLNEILELKIAIENALKTGETGVCLTYSHIEFGIKY